MTGLNLLFAHKSDSWQNTTGSLYRHE